MGFLLSGFEKLTHHPTVPKLRHVMLGLSLLLLILEGARVALALLIQKDTLKLFEDSYVVPENMYFGSQKLDL